MAKKKPAAPKPAPAAKEPLYRNRIKEVRLIKAKDLLINPANWRTHNEEQQSALGGILKEVGIVGALTGINTENGVLLLDGHLRQGMDPEIEWPVQILDLNEKEAAIVLASLDPISAKAGVDIEKLNELLDGLEVEDANLNHLLQGLLDDNPLEDDGIATEEEAGPEAMELRPHEHYDFLVILASDAMTWNKLLERLGIKSEPLFGKKKTKFGISRAIKAEKVLELLPDDNPLA